MSSSPDRSCVRSDDHWRNINTLASSGRKGLRCINIAVMIDPENPDASFQSGGYLIVC
jgi:hypothetical protein